MIRFSVPSLLSALTLSAVAVSVGTIAHAAAPLSVATLHALNPVASTLAIESESPRIHFAVGDTANYKMTISSFGGTMVMKITAVTADAVTIDQAVDLGFLGKQDAIEVIDAHTGAVKSITVNGQPQEVPAADDAQIVSEKLDTITVAAGTFKCLDVKIHMKKENTDAEQWANADQVPVGGMLKMVTSQQGMPVQAELTSFERGH